VKKFAVAILTFVLWWFLQFPLLVLYQQLCQLGLTLTIKTLLAQWPSTLRSSCNCNWRIPHDYGDLGSGDVIRIWPLLYLPHPESPHIFQWQYSRHSERVDLFNIIYSAYSTSVQLINDPSVIEVVREGRAKYVHVVWKTDLVVPEMNSGDRQQTEFWFRGITIPRGMLVTRGHGWKLFWFFELQQRPIQSNCNRDQWATMGDATFVCPTWDFGGPVGVNEGTTSNKYPPRYNGIYNNLLNWQNNPPFFSRVTLLRRRASMRIYEKKRKLVDHFLSVDHTSATLRNTSTFILKTIFPFSFCWQWQYRQSFLFVLRKAKIAVFYSWATLLARRVFSYLPDSKNKEEKSEAILRKPQRRSA